MILIIDTSWSGISFALKNTDGFTAIKKINVEKQSVELPVETQKFLTENNFNFSDISTIGIVIGPGSFTGIRLGIAYAKGVSIGLKVPVIPVNIFEIYLEQNPDAFVALDSKRGDFFVGAHDISPCTMTIDAVENIQMKYPKTVGHIPFDLLNAITIVERKLKLPAQPVIPMYLRPSYAEQNCKHS